MTEPVPADEVAEAVRRLAAAGLDVDEHQAREALTVSREATASARFRALAGRLEPTIAFDSRWPR